MHYRHGVHDSTTIHPDHTVSWVGLRASVKGTSPVDSDTGRGMYGNAHPLGGGGPDVLGAGDIKALVGTKRRLSMWRWLPGEGERPGVREMGK